jgi:hypothetical protein
VTHWAGLFVLFLIATFVAGIGIRLQSTGIERRHATIQPGMTILEVGEIMGVEMVDDQRPSMSPKGSAWWSLPQRFGESPVFLEVEFDDDGQVVRTGRAIADVPPP